MPTKDDCRKACFSGNIAPRGLTDDSNRLVIVQWRHSAGREEAFAFGRDDVPGEIGLKIEDFRELSAVSLIRAKLSMSEADLPGRRLRTPLLASAVPPWMMTKAV